MGFSIPRGKEIFRWGPVPLVATYGSIFFESLERTEAQYGFRWSDALLLFRDGRFVFIQDDELLKETGGAVFRSLVLSPTYEESKRAMEAGAEALERPYAQVTPDRLAALTDIEFLEEARGFNELALAFEVPTIGPEFGNYGSIPLLDAALVPFIPDAPERAEAIVTLTSSERESFYQEEEDALEAATDLTAHRDRYFWLQNSYAHVEDLPVAFFEQRKRELIPGLRGRHEARVHELRRKKHKLVTQRHISADVRALAERIVDAMELQDDRKKVMLKRHHYVDLFLKEFVRRGVANADRYMLHELCDILAGVRVPDRASTFGFVFSGGLLNEFGFKEAEAYWATYAHEAVVEGVSEIRGTVASKGAPVRGPAKIVLDPHTVTDDSFPDGAVLVAPMTSPEYVFLMKRAAAIVTDTGGLTSHAAIVSRELGKPCIINTKTATQIFRDDDTIEVDAEKGTVRKV